jgi:hypothetical protein
VKPEDFDPWTDTTPMVDPGRDDPFGDWPTDTTVGEVTGPHSYQSLVTRAATRPDQLGGTVMLITQWFLPLDRSYVNPACSKRLRVPL